MSAADATPSAAPVVLGRAIEVAQGLRGHRLPWLAICFGTGIAAYFALATEPSGAMFGLFALGAVICAGAGWLWRGGLGPFAFLVAAGLLGLVVAQARSYTVAGPVLAWRYHGAVEGRVVGIDRSASGALRITLDRVRLDRFAPDETPRRVRISMHGATDRPIPGARVMTTAFLSPPAGPAEPYGFDFQRHAFFKGLGAVGYAKVPLLAAEGPPTGLRSAIPRMRERLSESLRARIPGPVGEVATAITTGDRSGLPEDVVVSLRASNLAHLLAISGLHMGLLVGFVFWAVRGGLALIPSVALVHPTRSWAALTALPFAMTYLAISGGSVATQRAFVMAAVMLVAIVLGRRALSLRSVALAAIIVLLIRPEALTGPGFQMSFAATGALVVAFGAIARVDWMRMTGLRQAFFSTLMSSVIAGAATAPFAAAHFNRVGQYGVLANLLAVPVMGLAVMPPLLIGIILWPLGLEGVPFAIAGWGLQWILAVSDHVAGLPGSVRMIASPRPEVVALIGGALALTLAARGWGRAVAVAPAALAALLWIDTERPALLVADDGRITGTMSAEGRVLSHPTGSGFVAGVWLENDGDPADQAWAAERAMPRASDLPNVVVSRGKRATEADLAACESGWLVTSTPVEPDAARASPCRILDIQALRRTGSIALYRTPSGVAEITARDIQGQRPWAPR